MEVNFLDRFHIQRDGTIFYRTRGGRWKLKKFQVNRDGYYIILLGKGKSMMAHRAVAMVYLSNPESKPEVNHLDSNRKNNAWWNLEWVTAMENTDHAILAGGKQKRNPVCGVKGDGTGLWLRSLTEARWHGFDESNLWKCLKGRQRVHKGFTWHRP